MAEPKRRKVPSEHPEDAVARLMYATYQIECSRIAGTTRKPEKLNRLGRMDDERAEGEGEKYTSKQEKQLLFWRNMAVWVLEQHFDPEKFIRCQFVVLPVGANPPMPNQLKGSQALRNYYKAREVSRSLIESALASQLSEFQCEVATRTVPNGKSAEELWADILDDEVLRLSALFRYCVAVSVYCDPKTVNRSLVSPIIVKYREAAALQYIFKAEAYDEMWQDYLPIKWKQKAEAIYRNYYGLDAGRSDDAV